MNFHDNANNQRQSIALLWPRHGSKCYEYHNSNNLGVECSNTPYQSETKETKTLRNLPKVTNLWN